MKRIIFIIVAIALSLQGFSQGWVFISGTVADSLTGSPVAQHPVIIMSDSTQGYVYYNTVYTDSSGYYFDNVPVMSDTIGVLYVLTFDCNNFPQQYLVTYDPVNTTFTVDFRICTQAVICQAYFSYQQLAGTTFQFFDLSIGDISGWYWEFSDGVVSTEQNPLHTFNAQGWFTVSLSIYNQYTGCNDFYSKDIYVTDSSGFCSAYFEYAPDPQGSPDSFQFIDRSSGNLISWLWDFGDGTFSEEQNPYHSFPGPGSFTTCLTVNGINCTDTYCVDIVISDTVYQQIYGQVFAGNFPLQQGTVVLYSMNPDGFFMPLDDGCPVDSNGIYFFTLVPEGIYLIQAFPDDSSGFLPTYYGDVTNWQSANQILLGTTENPYNISLVTLPAESTISGPGSLTGQINGIGAERSYADKASVILLDESLNSIGFTRVSGSGWFEFPSLAYGSYNIRVELAGVNSDIMKFDITQEQPDLEVILNYSSAGVFGINDPAGPFPVSVYPVPSADFLNISFDLSFPQIISIELNSISGVSVYQMKDDFNQGLNKITIPVHTYSSGIYLLRIRNNMGSVVIKRVVILS